MLPMNLSSTLTLGLTLGAILATLHFVVLPAVVRLAWRAPRVRERDTPARHGLPFETVRITTAGQKQLHGWWITQGCAAPAAVLMHGWGGNAENLLPLGAALYRAGWSVLLADARNHGLSDDDGFSSMVKFAEDLDHALDWLKKRPDPGATRVALVGHSVGAAAALLCASRRRDLAAVVSLAAFAHPRAIMRSIMDANHIPYVPIGWWMLAFIERVIGARYDAIAPCATIARITCPVLLVHGSADASVPLADAHAIHAARGETAAELLVIPGADHRFVPLDRHVDVIVGFLGRHDGSGRFIEDDEGHQQGAEGEREHSTQRGAEHHQA